VKAQITLEFLAITTLLLLYLATVASVYSRAKHNLEIAVDKKVVEQVRKWIYFISQRPKNTEIKMDVTPYPKRYLEIVCGFPTILNTPTTTKKIYINSECDNLNLSKESCIKITSTGDGVKIEIC